ncbi:hypothetical protein ZTR_06097 [Talaromyces verruculosus]|nr:hypothetical protein ZTR_06097 [Talaromyces verruculosus]
MAIKMEGQFACIMMTITCGISYLLYGYDQGFMSGVLPAENFIETMGNLSNSMQGLLSSLYNLGCFFGCIASFAFSERLGRKKPILIGTTVIIIGAVIQTASYSRAQFSVGRLVAGCGTGLNTSVIPVWQAETLPAKKREAFGSLQYSLVCGGASVSYWLSYGLSYSTNTSFQWRFGVAAQLAFAVILLCFVPIMPESPRWLFLHNNTELAVKVLMKMYGTSDVQNEEVQKELKLINQAIEIEEMNNASRWLDLLKNKSETQNFRRLMLGWWLMFMVMWSGVCSIGYYVSYLFETSVGLSHNLSLLLSGFNGLWYLVSSFLPFFIIRKLGKCNMLMIGAFAPKLCICTRARGAAITTSSNGIWNFATVMMTPSVMGDLGWKGDLIFTIFNAAFVPVIYFFYPETTGRRLEEIDTIFYKTSAIVAFTEWSKEGHFESDHFDNLVQGMQDLKKGVMEVTHTEATA